MNRKNRRRGMKFDLPVAAAFLVFAAAVALPAAARGEKIPVTTSSDQARIQYLAGRDLLDKLRFSDARGNFVAATANDPDFALAWLDLARTAPTATEFFDELDRAVKLADRVSAGERLMILGLQAGINGDPDGQRGYYERLVDLHGDDERAHALLGNWHFARQEWEDALEHLTRATELEPDFAQPYNQIGYCHRFRKEYDEAEKAFARYVELLPGEANPLDSQAELLMKTGRFDESIETYEKALTIDPDFVPSYIGIGNDYIFKGEGEEARRTLDRLAAVAANAAQKRQALFWTAVSWLYEGNVEKALEAAEARLAGARADEDYSTMSGDLVFIGDMLYENERPAEALARYAQAVEMMEKADVPEEVKEAARVNHLYEEARIALRRGDLTKARAMKHAYRLHAQARSIPNEVRRAAELAGMIAAYDRHFHNAVRYYEGANRLDPRVLYLTAEALHGKGEVTRARELYREVADFNALNVNLAYVKGKAEEMLARTEGEVQ